jgi:hypothetical protein
MAAPVLGIPVINEPDLFRQCVESIDIPVRLFVIDNSTGDVDVDWLPPDTHVFKAPSNLGVPASWNLIIKSFPQEDFWLIANADTVFAPGDLQRLIDSTEYDWTGINGDLRCMKITFETLKTVGFFDENFYPIYCEDVDWGRRVRAAGLTVGSIQGETTHAGSICLKDYRTENDRTYADQKRYFHDKWSTTVDIGRDSTTFGSKEPWNGNYRRVAHGPEIERLRSNYWRKPG